MADMPPWEAVEPKGLAASILGVTITFTILCIAIIGLRIWIRLTTGGFGIDDWLMCIGTVINFVHNGFVLYGCFTGIGTRDSVLAGYSPLVSMEGAKVVVFWQIFYVSGSVFIKASICAQLMRIATRRLYKIIMWVLIGVSTVTTAVAITAVLIRCKPVSASWTQEGKCIDQNIIIVLTYVVSGVNIATDWVVAILPAFILWNLQMRATLKRMAGLVMGLGVLASVATIIRMPYSSAYANPHDLLYNVGNIILWTVIECDLGIIAGSMPMLRKLIKSLARDESSYAHSSSNNIDLVTFGRIQGKHHPIHDADISVTVAASDENDRDSGHSGHSGKDDTSSTKQMIRVMRTFNQSSTRGEGEFQKIKD